MSLSLVTLVVDEYDPAISFFVGVLEFELVEDSPAEASDGRPKRWVVVRPPGGGAGLLLAKAETDRQRSIVGTQTGGRVAFFLRVDDVEAAYRRFLERGVVFESAPRREPYGTVAVFRDCAGNRWDLIGGDD